MDPRNIDPKTRWRYSGDLLVPSKFIEDTKEIIVAAGIQLRQNEQATIHFINLSPFKIRPRILGRDISKIRPPAGDLSDCSVVASANVDVQHGTVIPALHFTVGCSGSMNGTESTSGDVSINSPSLHDEFILVAKNTHGHDEPFDFLVHVRIADLGYVYGK